MHKWLKWATLEAVMRSANHVLGKVVGVTATSFTQTFWSAGIIGAVQVLAGVIGIKAKREKFFSTWRETSGALLFGLNALVLTLLGFATFVAGADLGVRSVIVMLSIVPGAIIDRLFFQHRLVGRQWLGIAFGVLAGWVVVGQPRLTEAAALPLWVWLSLATSGLLAVSQGIAQRVKEINPLRKNFWGWAVAMLALGPALVWLPLTQVAGWDHALITLSWLSVIIGINVILLWTFNVWSYRDGAAIAIKKLVALGGNLVLNMLAGWFLFSEQLTGGKIVGILLYLLAFVLMDQGTWEFMSKRLARRVS